MSFDTIFNQLIALHTGFSLQRVSPKTFPNDVVTTSFRQGEKLTKSEQEAIVNLVRRGTCYRCRISKGRYCYAMSISKAIELALENYNKRK